MRAMAKENAETVTFIPTSVRLSADLRDRLAREATKNQRTLSHEIVKRLTDSLSPTDSSKRAMEMRGAVLHGNMAVGVNDIAGTYGDARHTAHEAILLTLFAQMSAERQLALLTLLRGP